MADVVRIPSRRATTPIIPETIEDVQRIAKGVHESGLAPQGMGSLEQIAVAIMHGLEIGMPPMQAIQKIAVINGRPSIWGDAVPALLWSAGFKIKEEPIIRPNTSEIRGYTCTITRPDGTEIARQFHEGDAKQAELLGKKGPWQQYPKRMLQMRARGLAARDGAADVLSGMYLAEEAQDIPENVPQITISEPIDITPSEPSWLDHPSLQPAEERPSIYFYKKEYDGETMPEITGQINDCDSAEKLMQIPNLYADEILAMPETYADGIRRLLAEKMETFKEAD